MKKMSLVTGLVCLTGLTTYGKNCSEAHTIPKKTLHETEVCSNDGRLIGKRHVVKHKGKKYYTCCKGCATELINRLESEC